MLEKLPNKSFSNFRFSVTKYVLFQAFQENLTAWTRQFMISFIYIFWFILFSTLQ